MPMMLQVRVRLVLAAGLVLTATAGAAEKPVPDGLICPAEAAGAELIATALAATEPGVTGLCVYYLYDPEDPDRAVTTTLRIATADYDPEQSFKAPKMDLGGMRLVEEATRPMAIGGRQAPATLIVLAANESDLGAVTETFDALTVFRLDGGRVISVEEEYTNLSAELRGPVREALLAAQRW
jgi:hypothetical protein